MSLISKALKKVQEARKNHLKNKPKDIVYLSDAPQSWPRTALMALLIIGTITAITMSTAAIRLTMQNTQTKQAQVIGLEKIIKAQEKRINGLIALINKNQKSTNSQIRALNTRVNEHYSNLKDAILDDKEEIGSLDRYSKTLDQKIEQISAAEKQAGNPTIPASGN